MGVVAAERELLFVGGTSRAGNPVTLENCGDWTSPERIAGPTSSCHTDAAPIAPPHGCDAGRRTRRISV